MSTIAKQITNNSFFQSIILFLIILNGIIIGLGTYDGFLSKYDTMINIILWGSQIIFTGEILMRIFSYHPHKKYFFMEFWNNFDFIIVVLSYIPGIGSFIVIVRLLRLLKILRIFSLSETLRNYLNHMSISIRILVYSGIIYLLLLYIFSIAGYYLFGPIIPSVWGNLHMAIYTNFLLSVFSDIQIIMDPIIKDKFAYILYFLVYYGVFISLFINTLVSILHKFNTKNK